MGKTTIEWTDASWNPVVGCTEVSPGCANCYAARFAATRLKNLPDYDGLAFKRTGSLDDVQSPNKYLEFNPHWRGRIRFLPHRLEEPLHWRKPRRIFVCDMGDLFHESVYGGWIDQVIHVIDQCPQHTFQILTKRAYRMHVLLRNYPMAEKKNVWLGVSVENQHFADERIPQLLETPAAVRFISAEPLLGPVNLKGMLGGSEVRKDQDGETCLAYNYGVDWVICGGESGANARPMHPDWARSLRDQCVAAGVPFFFKQWGEFAPMGTYTDSVAQNRTWPGVNLGNGQMMLRYGKKKAGRLLDGREWSEFPCP